MLEACGLSLFFDPSLSPNVRSQPEKRGQVKILGIGFFGIAPMPVEIYRQQKEKRSKRGRPAAIAPRPACPRAGAAGLASIESGAN